MEPLQMDTESGDGAGDGHNGSSKKFLWAKAVSKITAKKQLEGGMEISVPCDVISGPPTVTVSSHDAIESNQMERKESRGDLTPLADTGDARTITTIDDNEDFDLGWPDQEGELVFKRGLLYKGIYWPSLTNSFREPHLELRFTASAHTEGLGVDEYPDISGITTAREAMRKMTEEDKQKIAQQVEFFRSEKLKFDREVAKWDDTGNDIIVLAKHMCMIMMEMTDFTRGRGPLKTTMDVINAAKKISEAGTKLDKLTRQIADQCPESSTKKDLLAYLQRIALYCHQLNITSKVKADVQNISGELIVSGLDSATSLIQAAKNLMNAVVLTVKASYVASTKYPRPTGQVVSPIVVWKMKAPEKKPLVRPEKPEEVRAKVRKGSQKKVQNPIKALSEFQSPTESV